MKYAPYPKYKDSGVGWIGRIPEGWEVWKLSHAFETSSGTTPPAEDPQWYGGDTPWVTTGELRETEITQTEKAVTAEALRRFPTLKIVPKGAILLAMYGATIGRLGILGVDATMNQACCALNGREPAYNRFGYYILVAAKESILTLATGGGQPNISQEKIQTTSIPLPSVQTQKTIASFLDRETAKIDTLVRDYEDLIALLTEKRQALISHAVTRGLSELVEANDGEFGEWAQPVRFRDSGVEWLGEVPEGWSAKRLRYLVPGITVGIVVNPSAYYVDSGVPCLRSFNISSGKIVRDNLVYISDESNQLHSKSIIREGDMVVVRTGQTGIPAVVEADFDGANCIDLLIIRRGPHLVTTFLYFYLLSDWTRMQVEADSVGTIQAHYNTSTLSTLKLVEPSLAEQLAIAAFLTRETTKIDTLVREIQDAIELLREHRSALITAAVTGKINVEDHE